MQFKKINCKSHIQNSYTRGKNIDINFTQYSSIDPALILNDRVTPLLCYITLIVLLLVTYRFQRRFKPVMSRKIYSLNGTALSAEYGYRNKTNNKQKIQPLTVPFSTYSFYYPLASCKAISNQSSQLVFHKNLKNNKICDTHVQSIKDKNDLGSRILSNDIKKSMKYMYQNRTVKNNHLVNVYNVNEARSIFNNIKNKQNPNSIHGFSSTNTFNSNSFPNYNMKPYKRSIKASFISNINNSIISTKSINKFFSKYIPTVEQLENFGGILQPWLIKLSVSFHGKPKLKTNDLIKIRLLDIWKSYIITRNSIILYPFKTSKKKFKVKKTNISIKKQSINFKGLSKLDKLKLKLLLKPKIIRFLKSYITIEDIIPGLFNGFSGIWLSMITRNISSLISTQIWSSTPLRVRSIIISGSRVIKREPIEKLFGFEQIPLYTLEAAASISEFASKSRVRFGGKNYIPEVRIVDRRG